MIRFRFQVYYLGVRAYGRLHDRTYRFHGLFDRIVSYYHGFLLYDVRLEVSDELRLYLCFNCFVLDDLGYLYFYVDDVGDNLDNDFLDFYYDEYDIVDFLRDFFY